MLKRPDLPSEVQKWSDGIEKRLQTLESKSSYENPHVHNSLKMVDLSQTYTSDADNDDILTSDMAGFIPSLAAKLNITARVQQVLNGAKIYSPMIRVNFLLNDDPDTQRTYGDWQAWDSNSGTEKKLNWTISVPKALQGQSARVEIEVKCTTNDTSLLKHPVIHCYGVMIKVA